MTKKDMAIDFLKLASAGSVDEAYEQYVAHDFIHHNAYFKGDRESLVNGMKDAHETEPNKLLEVKHAFEEGELVAVHSRVLKSDAEIAVVHIFRFEDGKIVELWDVGMVVPEDSPNENGAF